MTPGRTFLRALAGSVNSFMMTAGGARYFHIELSSRYRWYVAPTRLVLVALSGVLGVSILWSVTQTVMTMRDWHDMQARLDLVSERLRRSTTSSASTPTVATTISAPVRWMSTSA